MEEDLIRRVQAAQAVMGTTPDAIDAIRREIVIKGGIPERIFFLAWTAAALLNDYATIG